MRALRRVVLALAAIVGFGAPARAADLSKFQHVQDTSFEETDGDRVLQLAIDVPAPPDAVYAVWTTAEGWESFAVRHARLDRFGVGAVIETSYAETFTPGAPGNIENKIAAYVPGRMITLQTVKAPRGFAHAEEFYRTVTVLEFDPAPDGGTRVTLSGVGFERTPAFDDLYEKFAVGNAYTLEKLRERFAAPGK